MEIINLCDSRDRNFTLGFKNKLLIITIEGFINFLHWPESGPRFFINLERILIYRRLIYRGSTVFRYKLEIYIF
jgi:hypothetical protein